MQDLSSRLAEGFWTALVMPILLNEPVIAHAAIALSSAHKDVALAPDRTQPRSERVVITHYNESLRHLRSAIGLGGKTTAGLVLVSCLLYTMLEQLRGRIKQVEMHLHSGLCLLKDVHQCLCVKMHGTTLPKRNASVDADQVKILQGFASLHLESQFLGTVSPDIDILVQSSVEDVPSRAFRSIEEARQSLNKLVHAILLISRRFLSMATAERKHQLSRLDIHNQALDLLQAWLRSYKATNFNDAKTDYDRQFARTILLNHYEMALIMWGNIGCTSESGYASHTTNFLVILEHSVKMWHLLPSLFAAQGASVGDDLATPLFLTALKCRVHRIRLQAIRLLNAISFNYSGWSSTLMSKIATEVMALEQDISNDKDHSHSTDISSLPRSSLNLIHEVRISSWETLTTVVRLRCQKWIGDGETKTFHYDIKLST